jgi:hypothetical protein
VRFKKRLHLIYQLPKDYRDIEQGDKGTKKPGSKPSNLPGKLTI